MTPERKAQLDAEWREKKRIVRETMVALRLEHGAVYWDAEQIAEKTGIPSELLYDGDEQTGILQELHDEGVLVDAGDIAWCTASDGVIFG